MKRIVIFTIILMALAACTAPEAQPAEPSATSMRPADMPNPASVYCTQQGNRLEIRTAADGSQYVMCIAPDGTTCGEWAYYRGECSLTATESPTAAATVVATADLSSSTAENASGGYMPPGTSEEIVDWWGVIRGT